MSNGVMRKRCEKCSKKYMIINQCKCQKYLCLNCAPYYQHNCDYKNWQQDKKDNLIESNPQINFVKVENI